MKQRAARRPPSYTMLSALLISKEIYEHIFLRSTLLVRAILVTGSPTVSRSAIIVKLPSRQLNIPLAVVC